MKKLLLLVALCVAVAMPIVKMASAEEANDDASVTDPSGPSWVDENGFVNIDEVPDQIGVLDENGNIAGYVDASLVFGPPPLPSTAMALDSDGDGTIATSLAVEMNDQVVGYVDENGFTYIEDMVP